MLTLTLVLCLGSVSKGQLSSISEGRLSISGPEGGGSIGAFGFSDGAYYNITLEREISILKGESPGFMYIVDSSSGKRQFSFLCVIEHSFQGSEDDIFLSHMQTRNSEGVVSQWFQIKGVICRLNYLMNAHPQKKTAENLTFGLRAVDLKKGRVFYIDLRKSPVQITQLGLQLPKSHDSLKDFDQIRKEIQNWQNNGNLTQHGKSFLFEAGPVAAQKPREAEMDQ
ncbi:hypothetical protein [Gimesia maris]|uniref:hypothetical protein n=1 Tax=Gimesia maris TaxID=122 RepID=UPI0012B8F941|nr:hypothetical protein [Gimesia maris]